MAVSWPAIQPVTLDLRLCAGVQTTFFMRVESYPAGL
jgi:hypothetical protein